MTLIKSSAVALIGALAVWFVSFSLASRLPAPSQNSLLHDDPAQTETSVAPFDVSVHNHKYSLTPRFEYHLRGRVVALSDAMGWTDISHRDWGDYLNTHDLCVAWGVNAEDVDLREFSITHGDWTCYFFTKSREEYSKFRLDQFSNNHILPATTAVAALVRDARIGDEISVEGQLVNYSIDGRGSRNTSTIRTDTGNGACEIIYVTDFKFLKRHNEFLYKLASLARFVSAASLVALLFSIFVWPFLRRN